MIQINLPFLPPTTNHAYINNGFGGRTLSAAGKKFKRETSAIITTKYAKQIASIRQNKPYVLFIRMYFKTLENASYPKKSNNRYKHLDATNRIKLVEDALSESIGVDDASNMTVVVSKLVGSPERTVLFLWSIEEEECIIHDALRYVDE